MKLKFTLGDTPRKLKLVGDIIDRGGGSKTTATSKMECFFITKRFILDVAAVLDLPLIDYDNFS